MVEKSKGHETCRLPQVSLSSTESVVVRDHTLGTSHLVKGPVVWVPRHANEEVPRSHELCLGTVQDEFPRTLDTSPPGPPTELIRTPPRCRAAGVANTCNLDAK